jgi:hypothetical protein
MHGHTNVKFLSVYIGPGNFGVVTLTYILPSIYRAHRSFCKYKCTAPEQSITVLTSSRIIYKTFGRMHRICCKKKVPDFFSVTILHLTKPDISNLVR